MANSADLSIDEAKLDRDADRLVRGYLTAGTRAVGRTTRNLEQKLERATQATVRGNLHRAWGSRTYPKSGGPARDPAGEIFVNGGTRTRGAIDYFTSPGRVRGKDGGATAVPLPAAGVRRRDPMITPAQWEAQHGVKLIPIQRRGRAMILAAPGRATGRSGTYRKMGRAPNAAEARRGYMSGEQLVPIFVIVPDRANANSVATGPIIDASRAGLTAEFLNEASRVG